MNNFVIDEGQILYSSGKHLFSNTSKTLVDPKPYDLIRVRKDREIVVGDVIVSSEGYETKILAISDTKIITNVRGETGINALAYNKEMFWSSFVKGERRFKNETVADMDIETIRKCLGKHEYIGGDKIPYVKLKDLIPGKRYRYVDKRENLIFKGKIDNEYVLVDGTYYNTETDENILFYDGPQPYVLSLYDIKQKLGLL